MYDTKYRNNAAIRRGLISLAIFLGVVLVIVASGVWFFATHVVVDTRLYSTTDDVLDLRGEGIAIEHYDALKEKLPGKMIRWDVPFQNGYYDNGSTELTVTHLSNDDLKVLSYFHDLKTIRAEDCEEYDQLLHLRTAEHGGILLLQEGIE